MIASVEIQTMRDVDIHCMLDDNNIVNEHRGHLPVIVRPRMQFKANIESISIYTHRLHYIPLHHFTI